jgi:hypothetical protein
MMDLTELRTSAIQFFEHGYPERLLDLLEKNSLNAKERAFIAEILKANVPKGPTGPEKNYAKPLKVALIWFWRHDIDGDPKASVYNAIGKAIRLKDNSTMVRKHLDQLQNPKTDGQLWAKAIAQQEIAKRKQAIAWGDDELIGLYRLHDLAPISAQ